MKRREAKELVKFVLSARLGGGDEGMVSEAMRRLSNCGYDPHDTSVLKDSLVCANCGKDLEKEALVCRICYREICHACDAATPETGPVCRMCNATTH